MSKIVSVILLIVASIGGWWIYKYKTRPIILPTYFYNDSSQEGLFTATGTWIDPRTNKPRMPTSTFSIVCQKNLGLCYSSEAASVDKYLTQSPVLYQIDTWTNEGITTKPDWAACSEIVIRVDRISKKVNSIYTLTNTEKKVCKNLSQTPEAPVLELGEGNQF